MLIWFLFNKLYIIIGFNILNIYYYILYDYRWECDKEYRFKEI